MEAARTAIEVADIALSAIECCHHKKGDRRPDIEHHDCSISNKELEAVRSENCRLKGLLEESIRIFQILSKYRCLPNDCSHDLYDRLTTTVDCEHLLSQLQTLHEATVSNCNLEFPFKEDTGEVLTNLGEPSPWIWITDDSVPSNFDEWSGIDDSNYVVVDEELVVDGVSDFIARCILANPKARKLTPEELQKSIAKALHCASKLENILSIWHTGKLFYSLSTWGLTLAGLYSSRGALKLAAKGVHKTSKIVLKAL